MFTPYFRKYFVHCHEKVREADETRQAGSNAQDRVDNLGHYHSPCFLSFLILRLMRSRFSMLRCCKKRIPLR